MLIALPLIALATFIYLAAGRGQAADRDWQSAYQYWHGAAVRQRARADDLQKRLTVRVLEAQQLTGRIALLSKAKRAPLRDVAYAIRLAATVYAVNETAMHRVASCESGHSSVAQNGQYRGLYQEGPMFERGPFGQAGFSVWDPVANAMTAAYTVAREGWSQWDCKP